jgi:hypothetical protein
MSPALLRVAALAALGVGGVVLPAVTLGAVAGKIASADRELLVTVVVTGAVAFLGGVAAEPSLRRWAGRPRPANQREPVPDVLPPRRS